MSLILRAVFLSKYSSYHSVMHEEKFLNDFFNYLLSIAQARSHGVVWVANATPGQEDTRFLLPLQIFLQLKI